MMLLKTTNNLYMYKIIHWYLLLCYTDIDIFQMEKTH